MEQSMLFKMVCSFTNILILISPMILSKVAVFDDFEVKEKINFFFVKFNM